MTAPEVIYFYIKGQGWLAGYEEHLPKPKPNPQPGWAAYTLGDVFILQADRAQREQHWIEAARAWARPVQIAHDYYIEDTPRWVREAPRTHHTPPLQNIPIQRVNPTPAPPQQERYFPGSNTPPERQEVQENQHERRANLFQRALTRLRRG